MITKIQTKQRHPIDTTQGSNHQNNNKDENVNRIKIKHRRRVRKKPIIRDHENDVNLTHGFRNVNGTDLGAKCDINDTSGSNSSVLAYVSSSLGQFPVSPTYPAPFVDTAAGTDEYQKRTSKRKRSKHRVRQRVVKQERKTNALPVVESSCDSDGLLKLPATALNPHARRSRTSHTNTRHSNHRKTSPPRRSQNTMTPSKKRTTKRIRKRKFPVSSSSSSSSRSCPNEDLMTIIAELQEDLETQRLLTGDTKKRRILRRRKRASEDSCDFSLPLPTGASEPYRPRRRLIGPVCFSACANSVSNIDDELTSLRNNPEISRFHNFMDCLMLSGKYVDVISHGTRIPSLLSYSEYEHNLTIEGKFMTVIRSKFILRRTTDRQSRILNSQKLQRDIPLDSILKLVYNAKHVHKIDPYSEYVPETDVAILTMSRSCLVIRFGNNEDFYNFTQATDLILKHRLY